MRRRLPLLLIAALLAGCAKPELVPAPQPEPSQVSNPPAPAAPITKAVPAPTISDLQARLAKADELLVGGQNREAVALLIDLVGAQPDSPGAWDLLTLGLVRLGAPIAGAMAGERAVTLQPNGATIRFNTGLAYYRATDYVKAIEHLTEAVRLNSVSDDPRTFLARAEAGHALLKRDKASLMALRSRLPADKEVEIFAAQFDPADLDDDGVSERFDRQPSSITVTSGRGGKLYLSLPLHSTQGAGSWGDFGLLGDEGDRFFLLSSATEPSHLFRFDGQTLIEVNARLTHAAFGANRELVSHYDDREKGATHFGVYTWKDGQLVELRSFTESWKEGRPVPPMVDSLDLFLAISQGQLAGRAFASPTLQQEAQKRVAGHLYQSFLLPKPDGTFRLELWADGALISAARATLDKEWRIERLDWE